MGGKSYVLFALCLVLFERFSYAMPSADWGNKIEVSGQVDDIIDYTMNSWESEDKLYMIWCESKGKTNILNARTLAKGETLSDIKTIDSQHKCNSAFVKAIDDKRSILGYYANRDQIHSNCDLNLNGCTDLYYTETLNGGLTWEEPRAVPREDMNDRVDRIFIDIEYSPRFQRTFIFYEIREPSGKRSLASVTRPSRSSIFQNEVIIKPDYYSLRADVASTFSDKNTVHIFYVSSRTSMVSRIFSKDNGVRWEEEELKWGSGYSDLYVTGGYEQRPSTMIMNFIKDNGDSQVIITKDDGKTWSSPVLLPGKCYDDMPLCEKGQTQVLLSSLTAQNGKVLVTGYLPIDKQEFVKMSAPGVSSTIENPYMDCIAYPDEQFGIYLTLLEVKSNSHTLYAYYRKSTLKGNFVVAAD